MRKKFTMLFVALLACVGVMKAQTVITDVAYLTDDMECIISTSERGGWAVNAGKSQFGSTSDYGFGIKTEASQDQHIFQFKTNDGKKYLYSVYAEKYVNKDRGMSEVAADAIEFITMDGSNAGKFVVKFDDTHFINLGGQNQMTIDDWGADPSYQYDAGNMVTITDVTSLRQSMNFVDVTYNYYVGKELKHTEVMKGQLVGTTPVAPTFGFVSFETPTGEISESNKVFNLQCTLDNTPLTFSTVESPVWQTVEMHRFGTFRIWDYTGEELVSVTEMSADKMGVVEDSKLWCFVGDHFGFKIYNKKAGFGITLNATSGNPKVGQAVDGNDEWFFAKSEVSAEANACCFTSRGVTYMNRNGQGQIGYYGNADNGSTCYFTAPETNFQPAAEEFCNVLANYKLPEGTPENAIGVYNFTEEQKNTFVDGVSAKPTAVSDMQALYALANEIKATAAVTSGYYFIKGTGTGNQSNWYVTYDGNQLKAIADANLGAKHVWSFETCEDGYKLLSCNLGKYANALAAAPNVTEVTSDQNGGAKFTFTNNNGSGKFIIKDGDNGVMRTENNGEINKWGTEANETWCLIPVTELGISINEFASICLPFDVEVEGATAYAIESIEGTAAKLAERTDIPAGQGAILEGNGTATLKLTTATSNWGDNMLKGTTVAKFIEAAAYVLAKPEGQEIGLYRAKLTDGSFLNNANKAYLPITSNAPMFSFDRGEGTTEIENSELKFEDSAVIYDLLGRRVEKMEKGIYIVNGKKIIK